MSAINEENSKNFINYTGAVPGQSLTNGRDAKQDWEQPPQFVNRREAELYILEELTEKEVFINVTDMIANDVPIDVLTRAYLMSGYSRGLWDVDLMMLLIESVGFIFMALAEKVGLDYELYAGESEEDATIDGAEQNKKIAQAADIVKEGLKSKNKVGIVSNELTEKIENIPEETIAEAKSLLAKEEPVVEQPRESLLGER
jgi:hypothetical protein|tara:strand:- start:9 stop:611 length:603 start_codon:yes stop_codon:yes gene_type:complete